MTNFTINLTEPARDDLRYIKEFLYERNQEACKKVLNYIFESIEKIPNNPNIGRIGKVLRTREFVLPKYPYFIVYQIKDENLLILRILHTSRKYPLS